MYMYIMQMYILNTMELLWIKVVYQKKKKKCKCLHGIITIFYIYVFSRRFYPKRLTLHSIYSFTFDQLLLSLGIEPMILALLVPCSTIELQESCSSNGVPKVPLLWIFENDLSCSV